MNYPELKDGALLPLVESFYTIQGEGYNTGKPAFFIRLGGCDVGCSWCDAKETWNPKRYPPIPIEEIVDQAVRHPAQAIVLTGGEPLSYPLEKLCTLLKSKGLEIFLETSGSHPVSGRFDLICLSPKREKHPVAGMHQLASELKVIIEKGEDFVWAEENRALVRKDCKLYLQPEWSKSKVILPRIIEYVKSNPSWNISLQAHKYMNIP